MGFIGDLAGGVAGAIGAGSGGEGTRDRAAALFEQIQDPRFDFSSLTPEEIKLVGTYHPEAIPTLERAGVELPASMTQGRAAQINALNKMQELGNEGLNLTDRAALSDIRNQQARQAQAQNAAVMQNMAARGLGGGGSELAARMMANQAATEGANQAGESLAARREQRALQALLGAGQMGSQLQGQDTEAANRKADILNAFNEANFRNRQDIAAQNALMGNQAQQYNLGQAQQVSNANVNARNAYAQDNLNRYNQLQQNLFGAKLQKAGGQYQALSDVARGQDAAQQARANMWRGIGEGVGGGAEYAFGMPPTPSKKKKDEVA